jgi:hypothetical protein
MSNYIFALGSLVLLFPILYFLPLGISRKGKVISAAASLCAAGLALAARDTFLLWQSIILILLFILVCAYIFGTRMTGVFFAAESASIEEERTDSMHQSKFSDKETAFSKNEAFSSDTVSIYKESPASPAAGIPSEYIAELDENSQEMADSPLEVEDDLENFLEETAENDNGAILSNIGTIPFIEKSHDIVPVQNDGESTLEDVYAETLFTIDEKAFGSEEDLPGISELAGPEELALPELDEEPGNDDYYYLADIEKMLDIPDQAPENYRNEEQDLKPDQNEEQRPDKEPEQEQAQEQEQEQEQEQKQEQQQEQEQQQQQQESPVAAWDELELLNASESKGPQTDGDNGNTTQRNIDSIYDLSIQAAIELDDSPLSDNIEGGYGYYFDAQNDSLSDTGEQDTLGRGEEKDTSNRLLRHQVLQTAVDQLKAMKVTMSAYDYEAMLKKCMLSNLQPAEYYTFASILMQHYLSLKEFAKLQMLLEELDGKYSKHPIIHQEIQFLQNKYFYN